MTQSPRDVIAHAIYRTQEHANSFIMVDHTLASRRLIAEHALVALTEAGYSVVPTAERAPAEATEHGVWLSDGDVAIRSREAHLEEVYPFARWLAHRMFQGSHVYRRKVIVTEGWTRVRVRDLRGDERRQYDEYRTRMIAMRKERSRG